MKQHNKITLILVILVLSIYYFLAYKFSPYNVLLIFISVIGLVTVLFEDVDNTDLKL